MKSNLNRYSALVLKRTNYGEADRILTLITPVGKKRAIARGVRKEKSKLAGAIEPLVVSDIVLASGKGELDVLTSARVDVYYMNIIKDYDRLQFAYEAMRLISKSSEMIDDPVWFSVLNEVLENLNTFSINLDLIMTWFYMKYSALEGHELNLNIDVDGSALSQDNKYWYDKNEKGLSIGEHGSLMASHIKLMRLIATKPIKVVAQVGGAGEVIGECLMIAKEHASIY